MWFEYYFLNLVLIGIALLFCGIVVLSIIRIWVKTTYISFDSNVNLKGKTIIVTGANSGIGKETARFMANHGARVIMACRNMVSAKIVRDDIAAESENSEVIIRHVDLSSLKSVREFCKEIIETEDKIDVLIHNAGYGSFISKAVSADGIEYTMATNHYGPFLMTHLLSDLLKKSAPCRIVVVSSLAHTCARLDPSNEATLNPVDCFPLRNYADSKLANILFTYELSRRLQGTGITVNALHPGVIDTEIWRNYPFPLNILSRFFQIFMRTLWEGVQTTLFVALSTSIDDVSGKYFVDCAIHKTSADSQNKEWQAMLWKMSKEIVGLKEDDPRF